MTPELGPAPRSEGGFGNEELDERALGAGAGGLDHGRPAQVRRGQLLVAVLVAVCGKDTGREQLAEGKRPADGSDTAHDAVGKLTTANSGIVPFALATTLGILY